MRPLSLKIGLILVFFLSSLNLYSQPFKEAKYGADSAARMECVRNLSILGEYVNINLFYYALDAFQEVLTDCPAASKNIYVHGARIYKYLIENEKDDVIKIRRLDSLMLIYDQRIKYFGEEGLVSGRKGLDLIRYSNRLEEGSQLLEKSMDDLQERAEDAAISGFLQVSSSLLRNGKITQADFLEDFNKANSIVELKKKTEVDPEKPKKLAESIAGIFMATEQIDCNNLALVLAAEFDSKKNDVEWLKRVSTMLEARRCQDAEFYSQCSEQLYLLQPSAETAVQLGNMFYRKRDEVKSMAYFMKATELESDPVKKARSLYMIAVIKGKESSQYKESRSYALESLKLNPNSGEPYLLIGNLYILSAKVCSSNDFEQKAIYWCAVDQFIRAKTIDPTTSDEANRLINQYSAYFPNKENAFFYGYTEGQNYTAGCWINESTRVRFQQ